MKINRKVRKRNKPFFSLGKFLILLVVDACLFAGTIIPQQSNISDAEQLLAQREQELNDIKIEYERELANLEYMKTNDYKLQQGAIKYGWHYSDDVMVLDPVE